MHIEFKTIMVPSDFSLYSRAAYRYAQKLADDDSRILLVHVVDDAPLTLGYVGLGAIQDVRSQVAEDAEKELKSLEDESPRVPVEHRVIHGAPAKAIVELAEAEKADLVVMGTHGRSGWDHLMLGSVTEKVLRKAPCPVLVVRDPSKE